MLRPAFLCLLGFSFLVALGCGSSDPTHAEGPPSQPGPSIGAPPSGNTVFDQNCLHCHAYSKDQPGPKRSGPSLADVGGKRTKEWLAAHIKDPKSHKPESKMPSFEKKLDTEQLKNVTDYVAGLK
jgi:mono/diheme cytochrome c family protein